MLSSIIDGADSLSNQRDKVIEVIEILRTAVDLVLLEPTNLDKETYSLSHIRHNCQIRDKFYALIDKLRGSISEQSLSNLLY